MEIEIFISEKDQTFLAVVEVLTAFLKVKLMIFRFGMLALDSSQVLMSSSLVRLDTSIPTLASVTLRPQTTPKPGQTRGQLDLDFTVSEDIPQPTWILQDMQ